MVMSFFPVVSYEFACTVLKTAVLSYLILIVFVPFFFILFYSIHSFGLPSSRDREHVSTSPHSQQDYGQEGRTTVTNVSASSLGLLQLLQERGISASRHPHHNPHCTHGGKPSSSTVSDRGGGGSPSGTEGRRNIFSWNLVEKLQSLGLHRVAAWGMMGPRWQREKSSQ